MNFRLQFFIAIRCDTFTYNPGIIQVVYVIGKIALKILRLCLISLLFFDFTIARLTLESGVTRWSGDAYILSRSRDISSLLPGLGVRLRTELGLSLLFLNFELCPDCDCRFSLHNIQLAISRLTSSLLTKICSKILACRTVAPFLASTH